MKKIKLIKKLTGNRNLLVLLLVVAGIAGVVGGWYILRSEPSNVYTFDPNFKRTTGERIADVSNRKVKTFEQCKQAGEPLLTKPEPDECYYDGVLYIQILRKGLEDLSQPRYLLDYYDCMREQSVPDHDHSACKAWTGGVFYYRGPEITNYEQCTKWSGEAVNLIPNAPCIAPDGTPITRY